MIGRLRPIDPAMDERSDIYKATVRLLRDVSRNHAAAAAEMCGSFEGEHSTVAVRAEAHGPAAPDRPPAGTGPDAIVAALLASEPEPQVRNLGAMLRALEDVGLEAVCRLARARDEATAFAAIEEARAGWLCGTVLNRAAETFGRG